MCSKFTDIDEPTNDVDTIQCGCGDKLLDGAAKGCLNCEGLILMINNLI